VTYDLAVESYDSILVVSSPGLVVLAVGGLLLLAGLCLELAMKPRCVWLEVAKGRKRGTRIAATLGGRDTDLWVESLLGDLAGALEAAQGEPE